MLFKKIDTYLAKKYIVTILFTMFVFTLISVAIDYSVKAEDFDNPENNLTASTIFFDYYLNWIPFINGMLLPIYALISVIFFTSRLASNSEFIAILNAGVSFRRIMVPYLFVAGILTVFQLLGNHYFIPKGNKTRLKFENTYVYHHNEKGKTDNIHMFIGPETKAYINRYSKKNKTIHGLWIEKIVDNKLKSVLKAKTAKWVEEPNVWKINNYQIRTFEGIKETYIEEPKKSVDTSFAIHPNDFIKYNNEKEMMTTTELYESIDRSKSRGLGNYKSYETEVYRRTADAFTTIILTLIGLAMASRKVRGGIGLHLAIGMGLGSIYIFLSKFSVTFANNPNVSSMIGVWIPNLIFIVISIFLIYKAQK